MKHITDSIIITAIAFLLSACHKPANEQDRDLQISIHYLEETELVSIVSHLAGIPGYDWEPEEMLAEYLIEVDSLFADYREHPAVRYAADSLWDDGFAWHFPMTLALRYRLTDGKIVYKDSLVDDFDDYYDSITPEHEAEFVKLLEQFYSDTQFHQFFLDHKPMYDDCCLAMQKVVDLIDFNWYESFFGPRHNSQFGIYLGIIIGPANYSVHQMDTEGSDIVNAVMGCCARNDEGQIYYGTHYTLPIIIHECNHSYCNPLDDEVWEQISANVTALFDRDPDFYASIAYGNPRSIMNETFVEACVARYLMSHDVDLNGYTAEDFIKIDEDQKKFLMIRDVVNVLAEREQHPDLYPTMHDFMPRYMEAVNAFKVPEQTTQE